MKKQKEKDSSLLSLLLMLATPFVLIISMATSALAVVGLLNLATMVGWFVSRGFIMKIIKLEGILMDNNEFIMHGKSMFLTDEEIKKFVEVQE